MIYQIEEQNKIADRELVHKNQRQSSNLGMPYESNVRLGSEGFISRPVSGSLFVMARDNVEAHSVMFIDTDLAKNDFISPSKTYEKFDKNTFGDCLKKQSQIKRKLQEKVYLPLSKMLTKAGVSNDIMMDQLISKYDSSSQITQTYLGDEESEHILDRFEKD